MILVFVNSHGCGHGNGGGKTQTYQQMLTDKSGSKADKAAGDMKMKF